MWYVKPIEANAKTSDTLVLAAGADVTIEAAGDDSQGNKVHVLAYAGGLMHVPGWGPTAIDLEGLTLHAASLPLCVDHNHNLAGVVGNGTPLIQAGQLFVDGQIVPVTESAKQILQMSKSGIKFQASVGVRPVATRNIRAGQSVTVNGQTIRHDKPWVLCTKGVLYEVSIAAIGADSLSSVMVAASIGNQKGAEEMDEKFIAWLAANGWENPDDLTEQQKKSLEASWKAETKEEKIEAKAGDIDAFIEAQAAETERISKIRTVCRGEFPTIEAQAIRERWSPEKAELEVLKQPRKVGPAIHDGSVKMDNKVLECAVRLSGEEKEDHLFKEYGEQTIEAAEKYRGIGIRQLVDLCCRMDGRPSPGFGDSPGDIMAAGFSTAGLSGILSDSARKSMQAAYRDFPSVAKMIAKKLTTSDFKTHTGYRLTGDFVMKELGAGGELKHATIDEESYTYSVDTFGRIFGVTRKMFINDDLGAFTEIPRMIGRGAALALEQAFWTLVLANTGTFFGTGNSNQITTALGSAGLKAAVTAFRKLTDTDGNPIMSIPKYLLVPPDLEGTADELYVSTNVNTGGSSTTDKVPNKNVYAGKYQPIVSPYLSNTGFTGFSTKAWYLLADPADVACFGIAYLNGTERPTIEDAALPSDVLGKAWRGYFDFGVCQIDKRGGVKSTGAG